MRRILPTLALTLLMSCATSGGPTIDLQWPGPPGKPLIEYNRSILGTTSLNRSLFGQVKDFFLGKSPDHYMAKPYGLASDGNTMLYLADTGKKSILILDLAAGTGKTIRSAGPREDLIEPINVIPDQAGNIYVADTRLGKIVVYDAERKFSHYIGGNGEITSPVGMAIDESSGRIFVVDSQLHEIHIFDLEGNHLGQFGQRGDERGEFYHPLGIAIGIDSTLYVTDAFHFAVQAFDLEGKYRFSFGPTRTGVGTMARPRDVAVDRDGHVYVTDALKHEVQVYTAIGEYLFAIGGMGTEAGQFRLPAGICITKSGQIFVSDSINRRVQEFVYLGRQTGG